MKILRALLLALIAVMLLASPAYADTPDPDSAPTIDDISIYRNILETGDWLMLIYANIPYATTPSTPVTSTFIWQLMAADGITELGSTLGTNYNEDGYGYNVYSMYWNADNVTGLGMVWETVTYKARLSGNPSVFDAPPIYNYSLDINMYSTLTDTAAVKTAIADRIIFLANDLDNKWGLAVLYSLLAETDTATVLSTYGESFFRGAITGLQAMAPAAFSSVVTAIDLDERVWTDEYSANLTNQWSGTWVETGQEAGKVLFGTTYDLLSIIIVLGLAGGLMIGNLALTSDAWNGFIDVSVWGVIAVKMGLYELAFLFLLAFICWFYIGTKIWFGWIK